MRVIILSLHFSHIQWACATCGWELNPSDTYPQKLTHPSWEETGFLFWKKRRTCTCKHAGKVVLTPSWEVE